MLRSRDEPASRYCPDHSHDLSRALTDSVVQVFAALSADLTVLHELYAVLAARNEAGHRGRVTASFVSSQPSDAHAVADYNEKHIRLIERFDHAFRVSGHNEQGRAYSETPGELCARLIMLTLRIDDEVSLQNDVRRAQDTRIHSMNKVYQLHLLRSHHQRCLKQMLNDIHEGVAILPPLSAFTKYGNPSVDPLTRKEVPLDIYSCARKADNVPLKATHILGFASNGHGASLSYIGRDGTVRSSVFDRWVGTKYTLLLSRAEIDDMLGGTSPLAKEMYDLLAYSYGHPPHYREFEHVFPHWLQWLLSGLDVRPEDIDLFVSSESNFITSSFRCTPYFHRWLPKARIVTDVEHHAIHQRQAFWPSGFDKAAVLTLDTGGEPLARLGGHKLCGTIATMDRDGHCTVLREFVFPYSSPGLIYSIVNDHLGFSQGQEGKTMGLAPYGRPDLYHRLVKHLRLYPDGSCDFLSYRELHDALENYERPRPKTKGADFTQKHCDVAFAGQALIEDIVINAFNAALRLTGLTNLVYAGGLALNSVANEVARNAARPEGLYIPPNPGDTGQGLGSALYAAYELAGWPPLPSEMPEYLGPCYSRDAVIKAVESSKWFTARRNDTERVIARCIANGHIIARFSGQAEFGPRALGNRSILADPRRKDMKDYLNARVKHREGFRPFAPSVLLEHASRWFDLHSRSPYMLRVVRVPQGLRDRIPAVVHVDGTARVQTVDRNEAPAYYGLIHAFYMITDVPLVVNTSFNIAGKPIVETPQDAVTCFESTDIDVLLLEDWILSKRPIEYFENVSR